MIWTFLVSQCFTQCGNNSLCTGKLLPFTDYACSCQDGYEYPQYTNNSCSAINNCATGNGGCSQNCIYDGPGTSHCSCNTGYSLSNKACLPINNCKSNNGGCGLNSTCTYTGPGANNCSCNVGYHSLDGLGKNCTKGRFIIQTPLICLIYLCRS